MVGVRTLGRFVAILVTAAAVLTPAATSRAVEAFDGRLQLHGFYENQTRVIARNFSGADDWDLSQWYQVLNLEMEFDIAPDGWGPFDIMSAYARLEFRYDCVWDRACHVFPSVNTFGDRARHLPKRLSDARRNGFSDNQRTGHVRKFAGIPPEFLGFEFGVPPIGPVIFNDRVPLEIFNVSGIATLFGVAGVDGDVGTPDDPAPFVLSDFEDFRFAARKVRGTVNGVGTQTLGPWLPKNFVTSIGALSNKPNPFNPLDANPTVLAREGPDGMLGTADDILNQNGSGALPFRPAPNIRFGETPVDQQFARGIYYPNPGLARAIRQDRFDNIDQNFREAELKWNRGASQQQTHFLKEAYIDIELLDSSLWLRLGKQSIVWGKTELFRTTDQFNPQDLALATLPSLEESRIALWAARAVYSLWSVGPLEDVRIELAANLDVFEGADFGQCGEPYTVNAACNLRAGLFAHGISGFGLAGATKPPDWWNEIRGLEVGFRAEWRWDRFSFALTDFYGFDDFPYVDQLFRYERNVDPYSGRLRRANSRGGCDPDGVRPDDDPLQGDTSACLQGGNDALANHHANQQLFAFICSTSIAFAAGLDPGVCAQSVFNSTNVLLPPALGLPPVSTIISAATTGDPNALVVGSAVLGLLGATVLANDIPLVDIGLGFDGTDDGVVNPADPANTGAPCVICTTFVGYDAVAGFPLLQDHLSREQQALIGCGELLGTDCSTDGIDLLNAEASALTSAWVTGPAAAQAGVTATNQPGQPGTVGSVARFGRNYCQRWVKDRGLVILPGCRAPGEPGYDSFIDGVPSTVAFNAAGGAALPTSAALTAATNCQNPGDDGIGFCDAGHPFTGEQFYSLMDAYSYNFQMLLVVFSAINAEGNVNDFLGGATATQVGTPEAPRCSWLTPQFCSNVQALLSVMGRRRNSTLAGGSNQFGRHDFVWHGGTSNRLKWDKRNVFGFSMDFAEDVTKTNWSVETTWLHDVNVANNDAIDGVSELDQFNLTISVDRPTFVNFLNQGRTIFINSQWFIRYEDGFEESMPRNGPFNVLFTITAFTGFYQDRLNPSITHVYDFMSESGAVLPSISYRFNESFSVEFGLALFYGKWQSTRLPLNPISLEDQAFSGAYRQFSERGLAVVRDRDEAFVRLRKTF